ncbi:E3 SUMO-PROTEIN LIGASE SIZ1-LIKE ISOFORM X1 [Salix purpurea]|uniref:E3 SUMO-PROTEIN LIGASE SIZ1-LIKE ISOFORM X1 n=1 Tax=Salix purpurea TaxID=77065 RepID=A0A9Q0TTX7_SALPP|nr:E3 SUMO-PROTEIN LIGASE SIZ1-LIKE ISOFORM X1 [Salix purpurea]
MEMNLVASCKGKLAYFRIKELKDILSLLGLSKQGKKQDLMDRVLGLLSDDEICSARSFVRKQQIGKEAVVKIIDDAYRKMQITNASDLAAETPSGLDTMSVKEEVEDFISTEKRIRCPCGSSLPSGFMIQCIDSKCRVQQHISCVIFLESPVESDHPIPPVFYCETCRIDRADPFWVTVAHLSLPMKLKSSYMDGNNTLQNVETTFQLTRADQHLLQNCEYDVQAWCMLLNDNVLFRMQWPHKANLQVNDIPVRTHNRPASQSLGANGRDDGAQIKLCTVEGINRVSLSGSDSRVFCFGIRLVKRQTAEQVLNLIPKVGESFEDALARVCRCIGGGIGATNEDSDSDLQVIAEAITVNLRCPMSGSRMKIAGRFKPCAHMGCFDLETFVRLNQRSRKWQCPICLKNYCLEDIVIDPYFNRITSMMGHCEEDITEIEVKPDGSWTVKTKVDIGDLGQWHFPDGSLCALTDEVTSCYENSRQIKKGDGLKAHVNPEIGIKNNPSGIMQGRNHQLAFCSSKNQLEGSFLNHAQRTITMSSSTTGSGRDEEDPSINQDYSGHVEISPISFHEINSICHYFDPTLAINSGSSVPSGNADFIILSDSDEENVNLVAPETVYDTYRVNGSGSSLAANPGITGSYLEDLALDAGANSCFGLFDTGVNDVGMSNWSYSSGTQAGPHFQLFNTDPDVSDAFIDLDHPSISCDVPMNGCTLESMPTITSGGEVLDSLACDANVDMDVGLVDNPMRFVSEDPSLQTFLPAQPVQPELVRQPPASNCAPTEDWFPLSLSSTGESFANHTRNHDQGAAKNGVDLRNQLGSNQATSVAALNDEARSNRKCNKKFSDGPFSFPRQPRSVRQRVYSQ